MSELQSDCLSVLIVEDDDDTVENLCDILAMEGHECRRAATFAEAMSELQKALPEVIILDRQLPDGVAETFIPKIKRLAPDLPIVVVTGFPDIDGAIKTLRQGAYDYLLKPINPDVLLHSLRKIVERRQHVDELREQREFAESLIQTARAIVLVLDPLGRIVRYNRFMEELSGVPLSEVVGQDWFTTFILSDDRQSVRSVFDRAVRGETIHSNVNAIKTRFGTPAIINWSSIHQANARGETTGIISVGLDITDLRNAQRKVVQNERLAAIGEMVTGLAHESRNAFQRSQACLEMLALDLEGQSESLKLVDKIQNALDHLNFLYDEVRSYAAPINIRLEAIAVPDLIRETWGHLESRWKDKGLSWQLVESGENLQLDGDRYQLEQVIRNLLENAIEACPENAKIEARFLEDNGEVRIEIHDSGTGIEPSRRSQIFQPFFTSKTKGTGLGLAIVRRIVEAHGGDVQVGESELGGAAFRITLPRNRKGEAEPSYAET